MARFTILHITDIHFGQWAMSGIWPTVRKEFFEDIKFMVEKLGRVDVIALTGDIANRANKNEYEVADEFLFDLVVMIYEQTGFYPLTALVPGNHDVRRSTKLSSQQRVLEQLWDDSVAEEVFASRESDLKTFIDEAFANYSSWVNSSVVPLVPLDHTGLLPGEFSSTVETDGFRIGLIGLNSTFRHLSDRAAPGMLTMSNVQAHAACGGDLPAWASGQHLSVLLSHHPLSWIDSPESLREALFSPSSSARLHLCGHLHDERYTAAGLGSTGGYLAHQGLSIFGIEPSQDPKSMDRRHGYAFITIDKAGAELRMRVWPRQYLRTPDGDGRFDRHAAFGLPKGENATSATIIRTLPLESHPAPVVAAARTTDLAMAPAPASAHDSTDQSSWRVKAKKLAGLISQGDVVCVLGDRCRPNSHEPTYQAFTKALTAVLHGLTGESSSGADHLLISLLDIKDSSALSDLIEKHLERPASEAVGQAKRIIDAPWAAVIELSPIQDIYLAVHSNESSSARITLFDGTHDDFRIPDPAKPIVLRLSSTYMTGRGRRGINLHGAMSQNRAANKWAKFASQIMARSPVVFMGDSLASLNLWSHITDRPTSHRLSRPPAFVVCPQVNDAELALLNLYGVEWIQSTVSSYVQDYLAPGRQELADGLKRQVKRRSYPAASAISLSTLLVNAKEGDKTFLLGRAPRWGDVLGGFAARLSVVDTLEAALVASAGKDIQVVMGTAGSGRTTSMMQAAVGMRGDGQSVGWIDSTVTIGIPEIVEEVHREDFDVVFVDDVDVFGTRAQRLVEQLAMPVGRKRKIVVGVRSVRAHLIESLPRRRQYALSKLTSGDIEELVEVLRRNNAIADRRQSDYDVRQSITGVAEGQLLVAMIQATSGLPFNKKVESEFASLSPVEQSIYAALAITSAEREAMTENQILASALGDPHEAWNAFNRLVRSNLVRRQSGTARFEVRHRVVAEAVRSYLRSIGQLKTAVMSVARTFADSAFDHRDSGDPDRRTLIRVINHSYLQQLRLAASEIREIYDEVQDVLDGDFHYWLQRGAFEVETGNDREALHALTTAMTTMGGEDDTRVLTEYSYLRFQLAKKYPSIETTAMAQDAIYDLGKVILRAGENSPHTFVVLAREGITWLMDAPLLAARRDELKAEVSRLLRLAERLSRTNEVVAAALRDASEKLGESILG